MSVKWNGKEVENPILRVLVLIWVAGSVTFGILCLVLVFAIVIPLSIPVHFILKLCHRRGFVKLEGNSFSYDVGLDGFRKR